MDVIEKWSDFNVAMLGATAALAGLVIVAATINITQIVKETALTSRLASAITGLVLAISVCTVGLIPDLTPVVYGAVGATLALIGAAFAASTTVRVYQSRHPENRARPVKAALAFAPPLVYLVGGVLLLAGAPFGLVVFAIGALAAIAAALMVSWVVLVEVLR
ncbi:hypothetical protein [Microbacterium sp. SORGH_AS_0888]|uniref:hypothetical protein n=1 Tax=Microbacterium sp. SORGH_AS_0888 TaxID=3041791 RepID=UPI0027860880|nr:hypothetical protein [Microbacterium sp. SORGH_AS_0888]MDQ1130837.1 Pyruvate/2-oxoacid:ferredoxin oxidoreductase gamma subunit [Microbacterium sp. SORGH_AS_0888]